MLSQREKYLAIARDLDLVPTAGSDFHGEAVAPFDHEQLREEVARGVKRAREEHGLQDLSRVAFFVTLLFEIGPKFDEDPHIREIMERWEVSTTTARKVLDELAAAGYARKEGTRGHISTGGPQPGPAPPCRRPISRR